MPKKNSCPNPDQRCDRSLSQTYRITEPGHRKRLTTIGTSLTSFVSAWSITSEPKAGQHRKRWPFD